jgi:hypothetical protein
MAGQHAETGFRTHDDVPWCEGLTATEVQVFWRTRCVVRGQCRESEPCWTASLRSRWSASSPLGFASYRLLVKLGVSAYGHENTNRKAPPKLLKDM